MSLQISIVETRFNALISPEDKIIITDNLALEKKYGFLSDKVCFTFIPEPAFTDGYDPEAELGYIRRQIRKCLLIQII